MSSFATVSLSPCSRAISSRTGATILHGPHQVAQKSTRTGFSLFSTSSLKVESVTLTGLPIGDPPRIIGRAECSVGGWCQGWRRRHGTSGPDGAGSGGDGVELRGHLGVDR